MNSLHIGLDPLKNKCQGRYILFVLHYASREGKNQGRWKREESKRVALLVLANLLAMLMKMVKIIKD